MKNPKSVNSITLLELLIAVSILTLLVLVGGGIYLSGWNMFREAQSLAQSHRNAVIPMAHIVKNLQGARNFSSSANMNILNFSVYTNISNRANITRRYLFQNANRQIVYDPNPSSPGDEEVIGTYISSGTQFTATGNLTATITINATDTRNQNPYTITSAVEARAGGEPPL